MQTDNDPWVSNLTRLERRIKVVLQEADKPYTQLWQVAWTKPSSLFSRRADGFDILDLKTIRSDVNGLLIRPEYLKVWEDVLAFYNGATGFEMAADPNEEFVPPSDSARDVLSGALTTPHESYGLIHASHASLPNNSKSRSAVIVTGHPGIGKSLWLYYALVRCLEQGRTVLLQVSLDEAFILNCHGVFEITTTVRGRLLSGSLSPSTWCLIDSNLRLKCVPDYVTDMSFFIVQAASPRDDRMKWIWKTTLRWCRYLMKPMTARELIAGLSLQVDAPEANESRLTEFFEKYGPSSRRHIK